MISHDEGPTTTQSGADKPSAKNEALLAAATDIFLENGFSAATTDMIQRAARISKSTMYACFANKEAIFAAVIERQCALFTEEVAAIRVAPGPIASTLSILGTAYLNLLLSPAGLALFRVVVSEAPRFPALGEHFYQSGPRVLSSMVAEHLAEAARRGEIDVLDIGAEVAARLFISLLRGDGHIECLSHPDARPSSAQRDQWVKLAVITFLNAFGVAARET